MYPAMNYDGEKKTDSLTLDIYPFQKSSFDLYEDDGLTREHRNGAFSKTLLEVDAGTGVNVKINASRGDFKGRNLNRVYLIDIHQAKLPAKVSVNGKGIKGYVSKESFDKALVGYYFDSVDKGGIVHIKTAGLSTSAAQLVYLK
ncbi:DUF5110 domain-containing protein [Pedobacter sp. NJ-S-72]